MERLETGPAAAVIDAVTRRAILGDNARRLHAPRFERVSVPVEGEPR